MLLVVIKQKPAMPSTVPFFARGGGKMQTSPAAILRICPVVTLSIKRVERIYGMNLPTALARRT